MKNELMKEKNKKRIALTQIVLLVIGIIAVSWGAGIVSADEGSKCTPNEYYCNEGTDHGLLLKCNGDGTSSQTIKRCVLGTCNAVTKTCEEYSETSASEAPKPPETTFDFKDTTSDVINAIIADEIKNFAKDLAKMEKEVVGATPTTKVKKTLLQKLFGEKISTFLTKDFIGQASIKSILINAGVAVVTAKVITYFAEKYASERNLGGIQVATWVGAGVGFGTATVLGALGVSGPLGWVAMGGVLVSYGVYMLTGYQTYSREVFTYKSSLWQPMTGENDCNACNNLEFGCSEYICHTYGKACKWLKDQPPYERCIKAEPESNPPIITPIKEAYGQKIFPDDELYEYNYSVSDAGAKIVYSGDEAGCVPPFSQIKIALGTNEVATCKISSEQKIGTITDDEFAAMKEMDQGDVDILNHTFTLPSILTASQSSLENSGYALTNGGNFIYYVRCKDIWGNKNSEDYLVSLCIQQGPDAKPPKIIGNSTSECSGGFCKNGIQTLSKFYVYTDEPADCKWDFQSTSYDNMNYEFEECSQNVNHLIGGSNYGCKGNLTGIKDGVENKYYVSCIDQPELKGTEDANKRNEGNPVEFILRGTNSLVIRNVKINGEQNGTILRDSTNNIKIKIEVETFAGAQEGKSRCSYSRTGEPNSYSLFNNDYKKNYIVKNTQDLNLVEGEYNYFIQCTDIAGNAAATMINFKIETDSEEPVVVRAFRDADTNSLTVITDEKAECVYANFNDLYYFEDGSLMTTINDVEHYTPWVNNQNYYIICRDVYGNPPDPGKHSFVARPFEIPELK